MPNGILLKQYRPHGVINVVNSLACLSNFTCQKPAFASSLENILPSDNLDNISLILGNGYISLSTPLLRAVRSTHILIPPLGLGAIVRPEHHSVAISTGSITPLSSIDSISALALSRNPAAIVRGEYKRRGFVPSLSLISNVSGKVPSPSNKHLYSVKGSKEYAHTASTIANNPSSLISLTPKRFLCAPLTTDTLVLVDLRFPFNTTLASP